MLGTGNAISSKYYNTCFLVCNGRDKVLVDGGGGNQLFTQLEKANVDYKTIHNVFLTHKHIDHIGGIIWLIYKVVDDMINGSYKGELNIYTHNECIKVIREICSSIFMPKQYSLIGNKINLIEVHDQERLTILSFKFKFFSLKSKRDKQFGFTINYNNKQFTCCGDEPLQNDLFYEGREADYLMMEACCLKKDEEEFKAYENLHLTVEDNAKIANLIKVKNLIIYHSEDKTFPNRKKIYKQEAKKFFKGKIIVPDDLEIIKLN